MNPRELTGIEAAIYAAAWGAAYIAHWIGPTHRAGSPKQAAEMARQDAEEALRRFREQSPQEKQ